MKWIPLFLLSAGCACGQLTQQAMQPFFGGNQNAVSTFYPTNAGQTMLYWFDTIPNPARNGVRNANAGGGSIPSNGGDAFSITNWFPATAGEGLYTQAGDSTHRPVYFSSGGGNSGTTPRVNFNVPGGTGCKFFSNPYTTVNDKITNFTVVMVLGISNCTAANTGIVVCNGAGFNFPFFDVSGSTFRIGSENGAHTVTGANTIQNIPYIITWIQAGASSRIDTNGVLYVSGNAGTGGINNPATVNIPSPTAGGSPAHTTQYIGDMSRFWMWTNTLSASDLTSAVNQCKIDFGFP